MNKTMKRLGVGAVIAALALAGATATGAAAFAAGGEFTNPYTFQLLNSAGSPITTGSLTSTTIQGVKINANCGSTIDASAQAFFGLYKADGTLVSSQGQLINASDDGVFGINGLKTTDTQVLMTNTNNGTPYVAQQSFQQFVTDNSLPAITNGSYQFRYICYNQAGGASAGGADAAANFFQVPVTITGTTWAVQVAKVNTSTSLSATLNGTTKVATFTTAVAPASGTAVPSGTVVVTNGASTLCTITLPATTCNSAALADGSYSTVATYSGDAAFNGSASSAYVFVVGAAGTATGTIEVDIPSTGNTGLTMTGTPSATIATTHTSNNRFVGSATFGTVTITDQRQIGAPTWHLQGTLTNLTAKTVAGASIPSTDLGWSPAFAGTPGAANPTLASVVLPTAQSGTGFDTAKPLAQGDVPVNAAANSTGVYALLQVDTAGNKPADQYLGTLTLTLTAP